MDAEDILAANTRVAPFFGTGPGCRLQIATCLPQSFGQQQVVRKSKSDLDVAKYKNHMRHVQNTCMKPNCPIIRAAMSTAAQFQLQFQDRSLVAQPAYLGMARLPSQGPTHHACFSKAAKELGSSHTRK